MENEKEQQTENPKEDLASLIERQEAANKKREELLEREERLEATRKLGGNTPQPVQEKPKEETAHEYRLRIEREAGML